MRGWRIAIVFAMSISACRSAPLPRDGAVFCTASPGARVLAIQPAPDGRLRFGLSVWSASGSNISVFGVADPVSQGWRYVNAGDACALDLTQTPDRGFRVQADPQADCHTLGGQNARIGEIAFAPSEDEGPVGARLNDPEAFQHAGRCAGGQ